MKNILTILIALIGMSCSRFEGEKPQTLHQYFDVVQVVKSQVEQLTKIQAKVKKTTQAQQTANEASTVNWQKELAIFLEGDINKPVLQDLYLVKKEGDKTAYIATEKKLKVQELVVEGNAATPQKIVIKLQDENQLYNTAKTLTLTFDNNLLKSYEVVGSQKVILNEALQYFVRGEVVK
ncbi:MAG: hypothetical protein ACOVQA_03175 [Thermoflexibacteraceae bacterium]|jgi:hypothetical protein